MLQHAVESGCHRQWVQGGFSPKIQTCFWTKNHRRHRKPLWLLFLPKARFCVSPQRCPQAAVCACLPSTLKSHALWHCISHHGSHPTLSEETDPATQPGHGRAGLGTGHTMWCPSCYSEEVATVMRTDTEVGLLRLGFLQLQQLLLKIAKTNSPVKVCGREKKTKPKKTPIFLKLGNISLWRILGEGACAASKHILEMSFCSQKNYLHWNITPRNCLPQNITVRWTFAVLLPQC